MTHCERVLRLLSDGRWHTHSEGYALNVILHSRVADLRKRGHVIEQRRDGDQYLYRLIAPGNNDTSRVSERKVHDCGTGRTVADWFAGSDSSGQEADRRAHGRVRAGSWGGAGESGTSAICSDQSGSEACPSRDADREAAGAVGADDCVIERRLGRLVSRPLGEAAGPDGDSNADVSRLTDRPVSEGGGTHLSPEGQQTLRTLNAAATPPAFANQLGSCGEGDPSEAAFSQPRGLDTATNGAHVESSPSPDELELTLFDIPAKPLWA